MPSYPVEDHGERLLRLEESVSDIKVSTALHTKSLADLAVKIDAGFSEVRTRLNEGTSRFDDHASDIEKLHEKTAALQKVESTRVKRWANAKKAVLPLLAAGAGVIVTKATELSWDKVVAFFGF